MNSNITEMDEVNVFCVGYVESATDGMSLYTGCYVFTTHDNALDFVKHQDSPYLDYVTGEKYECEDWGDDTAPTCGVPSDDWDVNKLPDTYNEGEVCVGYWVIRKGSL